MWMNGMVGGTLETIMKHRSPTGLVGRMMIMTLMAVVVLSKETLAFLAPKTTTVAFLQRQAQQMYWRATFDNRFDDPPESRHVIEYDDFLPDPDPSLEAADVLVACMGTLLQRKEDGLEVCWRFSSDRCRASLGGSLERFTQYSTNPVFGYLVKCVDYEVLSTGPVIKGTATRGDMQTILIEAKQTLDEVQEFPRRFLWTFQRERRPPRQNCWIIHEVIYVNNAYALTD